MRWSLVALALLAGCMRKMAPAPPMYAESAPSGAYGGYPADDYGYAEAADSGLRADAPRAPSMPMEPGPPPPPPPPSPEPAPAPAPTQAAPARMVHYEGWARLRVASPEDAVEQAIAVAEAAGGRTETLAGTELVVRVPVAKFQSSFTEILGLGDVMDKSVRADDVTEAYTAIDLRANMLRATRERLIELLAKATEEKEKLMLLQQITVVSEEIEGIEVQLRTLSDLAAMSRIAVSFVPRQAFQEPNGGPLLAGMGWVGSLSPFNRGTLDGDDKRVALPVPDGFVALSPKGPYLAESPEGAVSWTGRVRNDPVGTEAFWVDVLEERFVEEFVHSTRKEVGAWTCLGVDQPAVEAPYHWQICVSVNGSHLEVAQAWFPDPDAVARYGAAVDATLAGGGRS